MLTAMTEEDWTIVLRVFAASRSRRGDKGRNDRKFLEALHYFVVHNITWRALPEKFGRWNSIRAPLSATKATIPNQTATPRANAEYVRQSRIDPTPRMCPPSFRKHSTRHGHALNKLSASSNASSVSHFDARRRRRITARSSRLLSASS